MKLEHTCSITRRHTKQLIDATMAQLHAKIRALALHNLGVRVYCTTKVEKK